MANANSVLASIANVCSLVDPLDEHQVLDIIVSRGESTGNKYVDYETITADWDAGQWKSVLREFYVSYQKANLCQLSFEEIDPNMRVEPMIQAQKDIVEYKKAPDNYYIHLVNYEMDRPVAGTPIADPTPVLVAVYAAISSGENYGSVCWPPTAFVEQVVGDGITREDFYATVLEAMESPETLEAQVCAVAKANKDLTVQMKKAYKRLIGKDTETVMKGVATKAAAVGSATAVTAEHAVRKGKKFAGRVKDATYTAPEGEPVGKKKKKKVKAESTFDANDHSGHVKTFAKWGIILLIINGLATPTKWVLGITMVKMYMADGIMKALAPSLLTVFMCFVPVIGCACACAMVFAGIIPGKDPRKKLAYTLMCLCLLCTAYSALTLVKTVIAMLSAWASQTFTIENIAHGASKGLFDGVKGLFSGVVDGVKGWFR